MTSTTNTNWQSLPSARHTVYTAHSAHSHNSGTERGLNRAVHSRCPRRNYCVAVRTFSVSVSFYFVWVLLCNACRLRHSWALVGQIWQCIVWQYVWIFAMQTLWLLPGDSVLTKGKGLELIPSIPRLIDPGVLFLFLFESSSLFLFLFVFKNGVRIHAYSYFDRTLG